MIEIRYLQAESGANKFGTCNCCGKSSGEDPLMISVKFSYYGHGTLICLCDDCKKKLMEALPPANNSEIPNSSDTISRQAAIDALLGITAMRNTIPLDSAIFNIKKLPSAQPEIIRCKDCIYYDPPHVENNGVRYEYDEIPADAFDALGTGLVNAEYGINIGGRCCVDYYCKNYSDDKRIFVREDNYCGRAERRTDG